MSPTPSATKKLIAQAIQARRKEIWDWARAHAKEAPPPFYCSVDLRDSGHKIVPVDHNMYPAGFNNICPEDMRNAPEALKREFAETGRDSTRKILILPESHTTNLNYIENLYYLMQIIENAGLEAKLGWFGPMPEGSAGAVKLTSSTGKPLEAHPVDVTADGTMSCAGFVPDLILLNNDFSRGYPEALDHVRQPIVPSHTLGWHSRKKSEHFEHYNRLAGEFARIIGIDPWLIQIDTEQVGPVNFNEDQGIEEVAKSVEGLLERTRLAYEAHNIKRKPFAFIKNNSGTYGMGIMTAHSVEEVRSMNRRTKNKMSVGKNKSPIQSVVVQEGIPTATLVDRLPAEPVIYLLGSELIGGFLRANSERTDEGNLNSQGMVFRKLCMSDLRKPSDDLTDEDLKDEPVLELIYGSVARISALAAGRELLEHARRSTH